MVVWLFRLPNITDICIFRGIMGRLFKKKTLSQKQKSKKNIKTTEAYQAGEGSFAKKKQPFTVKKNSLSEIKSASEKKKANFIYKSLQFLREVKIELKKVTWPTRKQTISSTIVVIIIVFLISFFLGIIDIALSNILRLILP